MSQDEGRCFVERDGGIYRIVNPSGVVWAWASEENTARHVAAAINHWTFPERDCPCARCRRRAAVADPERQERTKVAALVGAVRAWDAHREAALARTDWTRRALAAWTLVDMDNEVRVSAALADLEETP